MDSPHNRTPVKHFPSQLRRAWFNLNQAFRRRLCNIDITPDQFTALRWIKDFDEAGLTQVQLCDLMASDPNTITSLLGRMEKLDMVKRVPDENDRRAMRVHMSATGNVLFEKASEIAKELQGDVLQDISEEELALIHMALTKLSDGCQKANIKTRCDNT